MAAVAAGLPRRPARRGRHAAYCQALDVVADYFQNPRAAGTAVPVIFRPFHEHPRLYTLP